MNERSTKYALFAVLLLATGAVAELTRVVFDSSAPGFTEPHSHTISIGLAVLWGATALAVAFRHRQPWIATGAWVLAVVSTFAMVAHAFLLRIADAWYGGLYMAGAPILGFLLWRALARGPEYRRLRREARHEA